MFLKLFSQSAARSCWLYFRLYKCSLSALAKYSLFSRNFCFISLPTDRHWSYTRRNSFGTHEHSRTRLDPIIMVRVVCEKRKHIGEFCAILRMFLFVCASLDVRISQTWEVLRGFSIDAFSSVDFATSLSILLDLHHHTQSPDSLASDVHKAHLKGRGKKNIRSDESSSSIFFRFLSNAK